MTLHLNNEDASVCSKWRLLITANQSDSGDSNRVIAFLVNLVLFTQIVLSFFVVVANTFFVCMFTVVETL